MLLLEFISDHNYAQSCFLPGALLPSDDQLVSVLDSSVELEHESRKLSYLNPAGRAVHVLNKFISFDEIQA